MKRNAYLSSFLLLALAGCSSGPSDKDAKKAGVGTDKIQGKAEIVVAESTGTDSALSAGGPAVYLLEGPRRYRLFLKAPYQVEAGKEYMAEGIYAQKAIDEIGDPDRGKNGYPLQSSCDHVVRMAWPGLAFDVTDAHSGVLCAKVKRFPARAIFLVTKIQPVPAKEGDAAKSKKDGAGDEEIEAVAVPADKERALLIEGPVVQSAPLWAPDAGTARCKVVIGKDGKILKLETGAQLCEMVPWHQFRFQPTVKGGKSVNVRTEVEVRFDARK